MQNRYEWWDWSHLVNALSERLIMDAHMYRKHGITECSDEVADEMEAVGWLLQDLHKFDDYFELEEQQNKLNEALDIIRDRLFYWWD